jgi:hypothetical protein
LAAARAAADLETAGSIVEGPAEAGSGSGDSTPGEGSLLLAGWAVTASAAEQQPAVGDRRVRQAALEVEMTSGRFGRWRHWESGPEEESRRDGPGRFPAGVDGWNRPGVGRGMRAGGGMMTAVCWAAGSSVVVQMRVSCQKQAPGVVCWRWTWLRKSKAPRQWEKKNNKTQK